MIKKENFLLSIRYLVFLFASLTVVIGFSVFSETLAANEYTNLGLYGGQILDISIMSTSPETVYAGSYLGDGLFLSSNNGGSWQPVETNGSIRKEDDFKNQSVFAIAIAPSDPQIIWVAHNYWVEKSVDGGQTWTHILNETMQRDCTNCGGANDDFRFCTAIGIDPDDPQTVYVGTAGPLNTYSAGAIYKTTDGGVTWTKLTNVRDISGNPVTDFNYPILSIAVDPDSNNIWAATGTDDFWFGSLYWSNDAGTNWISRTELGTKWFDMVLLPHGPGENSVHLIATAFGLYRSVRDASDNANFVEDAWPLGGAWGTENQIRTIAVDPNNAQVVYTAWKTPTNWGGDGIGKIGRSLDGGKTWEIYPHDYNFFSLAVSIDNPEVIFAGDINQGLFKSENHGQTWTPISNGLTAVNVHDVAVDPKDSTHFLAGTTSGLFEKNGSTNWKQLLSFNTRSVQFHPTNSQNFLAGLEGSIARTTDGGGTFSYTYIPGIDGWYYNYISDIEIDSTNPDTIFISVNGFGNYGEIYKSTDSGATFQSKLIGSNQGGEAYPFNTVVIDPSNPLLVYAGGGNFNAPKVLGDVWKSMDGGDNWARTGLTDTIVNALLVDPQTPNVVYAGAGYSGGTEGGTDLPLYKSEDGGNNWVGAIDGMPEIGSWNAVTDLALYTHNSNTILYASTLSQGVYISPNQAGNWLNLGTPPYDVNALATGSLFSACEGGLLQLTGTGLLYGQVVDSLTRAPIDGATVYTDTAGEMAQSVNGEYMMVVQAKYDLAVTAVADGHSNKTEENSFVLGGEAQHVDFYMESGVPDPNLTISGGLSEPPGGGCFIDTTKSGGVFHSLKRSFPAAIFSCSLSKKFSPVLGLTFLLILFGVLLYLEYISSASTSRQISEENTHLPKKIRFPFMLLCFLLLYPAYVSQAATISQSVGVASSPNPVGSGARAVGMGGAFIAIADDATAASWNPAGLIQLERPEVSLVGDYFSRRESFSSTVHPEIHNTGTVDDANINYFSASFPYQLFQRNIVSSINYQRLYDFKREFDYQIDFAPASFTQDIQYNQDGDVGALGLATAIQISPDFSLGLTVNLWTHRLLWDNGWEETYLERGVGTVGGVPATIDTLLTEKYSRFSGINANLGLLWTINNNFTLGAVVKTPFDADLYHEFSFLSTTTVATVPATITTNQQHIAENVKLRMPWSYGLGLAFRVSDALSFALDLYRTEWGDYILTDSQGNKFSPIDGRPENLSDVSATNQVRFGGEYLFIGEKYVVPVRGGIFYDPEPSEGSVKDFYGIAVGTGLVFDRFSVDIAYELRWGNNVDTGNLITTSEADITQHRFLASVIAYF